MVKISVFRYPFFVFCFLLFGCQTAVSPSSPTSIQPNPLNTQPTPTLTNPLTPSPPHPATLSPHPPITPSPPPPDTGWTTLQTGLERRTIRLLDAAGRQTEQLYLLRIDPAYFDFQIAYSPGRPKSLPAWQVETGALVVVNGGYFTETYEATGVIVVDGAASGVSYTGFGGMFAVLDAGPEVRRLTERPYSPDEPLRFALQSFPVLVRPGGAPGFPNEDGITARRAVVAQDRNGRILFILAPFGSFTLHEMSVFLVDSDLDIEVALNLDGGTSTGLVLAEPAESVLAFTAVPAVITVYPRE